jgi:hypothetical protein
MGYKGSGQGSVCAKASPATLDCGLPTRSEIETDWRFSEERRENPQQ